jgi:hypothetical protein
MDNARIEGKLRWRPGIPWRLFERLAIQVNMAKVIVIKKGLG